MTVLASAAILTALLAAPARVLTSPTAFSARALRVVHAGAVHLLMVNTVTAQVADLVPGAPGLRPLINGAVTEALASRPVTDELRAAAGSLQAQLASGQATTLTVALPGVGSQLASTVGSVSPLLAGVVSHVGTITVLNVGLPPTLSRLAADLQHVGQDASLFWVLAAALVALALTLSPDRRRTLFRLGVGALIAGVTVVVLYLVGRVAVVGAFSTPATRTLARVAFSVYLGSLERSGLAVAAGGAGAVVLAVALRPRRRARRSYA
ncbi:MAG: hypothetical protein ACP5H2_05120 [Solirubrobacteraceae bacterium]